MSTPDSFRLCSGDTLKLFISRVGTDYAKYLSVKHGVPLIPIHHMEAHALTARMVERVGEEMRSSASDL